MENMKTKKKCFFVTAIGADDSETRLHMERVYANILQPVLGAEYKIIVSHRIHSADDINETILKHLQHDELVIADFTELNPNVFFEIGYRYAMSKEMIYIAQKGTRIPFDLNTKRTLFYEHTPAGYTNAKDYLKDILDDLNDENKYLKSNRAFKEYEGWWLEYIPDEPQNKYTIIHFYYDTNEDRYELRGRNYTSDFNSRHCLKFGSDSIIEDKNPQILHYVTDTTIDIATCTGTIIFQKPEEEIVFAEGYYIDVTNATDDVLIKRKTKMIMFNKAFWVKIGKNSDEWQDDLKYDDILAYAKEAFEQFI